MNKKIFALGFFDGVHLGHQALLRQCVLQAERMGAAPAAITFDRHPQTLFTPTPPALINTTEDRQRLLSRYGIRTIRQIPVTRENMAVSWQDFLLQLLEDGAVGFVCGEDFRFGSRGEGNARVLAEFCRERGIYCCVVEDQRMRGIRVSSTYIRELVEQGDMETAAAFLGHPHILTGQVVQGRHLGRTIGVPTANILLPEGVAVPKAGVYVCKCAIDGREYVAVTNVGSRPTVHGHQMRTESWILHYEGDLYGRELTLEFYKFLRPEQKFASLEELKHQIHQDGWYAWETFFGRY